MSDDPFAGTIDPESIQCRRGFHGNCRRDPDKCECSCHDLTIEPPPPRPTLVAPPLGAREETAAPEVEVRAEWPCRDAYCSHQPFSSPQGERVHYARMHRNQPPISVFDQREENEVLDVEEEETEDEVHEYGVLATEVGEAIAFLEGREWDEIVNEALDEWAARVLSADAEVKALVTIRRERRERKLVG